MSGGRKDEEWGDVSITKAGIAGDKQKIGQWDDNILRMASGHDTGVQLSANFSTWIAAERGEYTWSLKSIFFSKQSVIWAYKPEKMKEGVRATLPTTLPVS